MPYQTQYEELYKIYSKVQTSMVTVTAVHSDVDWFNNTYQSEGTTAGSDSPRCCGKNSPRFPPGLPSFPL